MSDLPRDEPAGEEDFELPPDGEEEGEGDPPEDGAPEGDEPEGDEPEGDEGDGEPAPRQPAARRPGRTERLRNEVADLRRELAEVRRAPPTQQQPQADPGAQERARAQFLAELEVLPPAEAALRALQVGEQRFSRALAQQEAAITERLDKQAYDAAKATSRVHQRYEARVEAAIRDERARGNVGITRDALLKYFVGEDAMRRGTSAAPGQRRAAARRVASQTTRPSSARGDGGGTGRRSADDSIEAVRARLRGKPLWD